MIDDTALFDLRTLFSLTFVASIWPFVHIFQAMTTLLTLNHFKRVFMTFHPNSCMAVDNFN